MSHIGVLTRLGGGAKEQVTWDTDDAKSLIAAKGKFQAYVADGYTAFKTEKSANGKSQDVQTKDFDETAEEIVMVPRLVGG